MRCLGNTSPSETPANKGVLGDLVKCEVFFLFHIIFVHRDAERQSFLCDIGAPIVVNLKEIPVITIII